ncbi:MAG: hypothetical protein JSS02_13125 [Planctomycetes bacterium]|nr:hypothetical protein [Planctomycetota bacterium]
MPPDNSLLVWFALGFTICGAVVVWLSIRFINRREKWARRALMGTVVTLLFSPVLYLLALGPVMFLESRGWLPETLMQVVEYPLLIFGFYFGAFPGEWFWDHYALYLSWWVGTPPP